MAEDSLDVPKLLIQLHLSFQCLNQSLSLRLSLLPPCLDLIRSQTCSVAILLLILRDKLLCIQPLALLIPVTLLNPIALLCILIIHELFSSQSNRRDIPVQLLPPVHHHWLIDGGFGVAGESSRKIKCLFVHFADIQLLLFLMAFLDPLFDSLDLFVHVTDLDGWFLLGGVLGWQVRTSGFGILERGVMGGIPSGSVLDGISVPTGSPWDIVLIKSILACLNEHFAFHDLRLGLLHSLYFWGFLFVLKIFWSVFFQMLLDIVLVKAAQDMIKLSFNLIDRSLLLFAVPNWDLNGFWDINWLPLRRLPPELGDILELIHPAHNTLPKVRPFRRSPLQPLSHLGVFKGGRVLILLGEEDRSEYTGWFRFLVPLYIFESIQVGGLERDLSQRFRVMLLSREPILRPMLSLDLQQPLLCVAVQVTTGCSNRPLPGLFPNGPIGLVAPCLVSIPWQGFVREILCLFVHFYY